MTPSVDAIDHLRHTYVFQLFKHTGGGGGLGFILDGMYKHKFEGNESFFSFKRMK